MLPHTAPLIKIAATAPDDRFLTLEKTTHTEQISPYREQLRLERVVASWTPSHVRFTYDDADDAPGVLSCVYTNDNRLVKKYEYGLGRVPDFTGEWVADDRFTSYTHDVNGNVIGVNRNGIHQTTYTLDQYGRVATKTTPLGTTTYRHDNRGHVREVIDVEGRSSYSDFDTRDRKTATGSKGTTTTYAYDDNDLMTTVTDAAANKTVYTYDWRDRVVKVTDPLLRETTYQYSPTSGTLTSVTDPEGGVVAYEYDIYGKVTKLTDQRNYSTTYQYDSLGRLEVETNPLNQSTTYAYHEESGCSSCGGGGGGHLASKTTPDGKITEYEYDDGGRLVNTSYLASNGITLENSVIHTYDDYGRKLSTFDDRLPVTDFPTQTFFYEYDDFDRMVKETYPDGKEVEWTYDVNGRRTSLIDPDDNTTQYQYDNSPINKKLHYINHPVSGDTGLYYWSSTGLLHSKQNWEPGFLRHTDDRYYDSLNRLANTWSFHTGGEFLIQQYSYNNGSQIVRKDVAHTNPTTTVRDYARYYSYDDANRLLSEEKRSGDWNGPDSRDYRYDYAYDLAGNRTSRVHDLYGYDETNLYIYNEFNQLTDRHDLSDMYVEAYYYQYDNNGNRTSYSMSGPEMNGWQHDRNNRLIATSTAEVNTATFTYDYSGRLLMKEADGHKTKYYYDGINTLLTQEKPDGGSCWRTKTVYALEKAAIGQVMATREYAYNGTSCTPQSYEDTWYKYDHIGNVVAELDYNGAITSRIDMEAFGAVQSGGQDGIRLTTKEHHGEAGLYYFGARWFDQNMGRWLQKDPERSFNAYRPIKNDPVNYYDSNGQFAIIVQGLQAQAALCGSRVLSQMVFELYPGLQEGRINDKFAHCYAACTAQQECGWNPYFKGQFKFAEDIWEFEPLSSPDPESPEDRRANNDGLECGKCTSGPSGCEGCCNQAGHPTNHPFFNNIN